jgi:glycosyltransferase involved in cell wall biosynthesis
MSLRLGIDADNFARDRRGMGRVARAIAQAALDDAGTVVTFLLRRSRDEAALRAAFPERAIAVCDADSARRADRYDVVWFPWNGMRFQAKAPAVVTINDAFAFTYAARNPVARAREQGPILRGAREAARIIVPSHWTLAEIERELSVPPSRCVVIPYAPDPMFFPGDDDSPMREWRYVLLVGVREPRKNAAVAIAACASAFSDARDRLVIVGDLAPNDARTLSRRSVNHAVLRDVDDRTLRSLYRGAQVVAVPSTGEGFGLVACEAMACGTATLAANAAALPEATADAALLIDPHDAGAWRDAVALMLRDEGAATALAARGAERFAFAPRSAPANGYLRVFRQVAA